MVRYSIAICNYNMADTLEESLRSILDQVDDRFEVLVVDGGSTDGSVEILDALDTEYDQLRYLALPPDDSRKLGQDRHISVEESKGEYVMLHLDCDDRYREGIWNFAEVYRQLDSQLDFQFGLVGSHITMAPRDFILDLGSYRNVQAAEDLDLWRRMIAVDGFIGVDCNPFWEKIGYRKGIRRKTSRLFAQRISEFQLGMSYWSRVKHTFNLDDSISRPLFDILISSLAYPLSRLKEQFEMPDDMHRYENYAQEASQRTMPLSAIENEYDVEIDITRLNEQGEAIFPDIYQETPKVTNNGSRRCG